MNKTMTINRPIFLLEIEGDIKYNVDQIPMTVYSHYQSRENKTYVITYSESKGHAKNIKDLYYNVHSDLKVHKNKYAKEQVKIKFLDKGISFITHKYE